MGINWKWADSYTTSTTTGDPIEIKAPEWKIGDKIELNSPIDIGVVGEPKGWILWELIGNGQIHILRLLRQVSRLKLKHLRGKLGIKLKLIVQLTMVGFVHAAAA